MEILKSVFLQRFRKNSERYGKEALAGDYANSSYGFIVRTNAASLSLAELRSELDKQIGAYEQLKVLARSSEHMFFMYEASAKRISGCFEKYLSRWSTGNSRRRCTII